MSTRTPLFHLTLRAKNNRLLQLRLERGWTQDDMGQMIGFSSGTYGNLENLRTLPHYTNGEWRAAAVALSEVLGKSLDFLFPAQIIEGQVNRLIAEMSPVEMARIFDAWESLGFDVDEAS
jgi:transcriptional regulator with XRE-family HTH domain